MIGNEIAMQIDQLQARLKACEAEIERLTRELHAALASRATLLDAAAHWRGCFDTIDDPIAVLQGGCIVSRANESFARLAGVQVTQLPGLRCKEDRFGALPCPGAGLAGAGRGEREVAVDGRLWLLRFFPFDAERQVVVFKDVTREREAAARSLRSERMGAESRLAGGVAQEINSPLAGILALAQLMRSEERSAADAVKLDAIVDAALRSKHVLDSLLPLAQRLREEDKVRVDLADVAADALFLLAPRTPRGVEVLRSLDPAACMGNEKLLTQLVMSLALNSLEAMGRTGRLTVQTGLSPWGSATLSVSDDGPGVPPEHAGRIFEPFFTTKSRACGLGLSACGRIVEQHRGAIRLDPSAGGGARFVVELPGAGASRGGAS